MWQNFKLPIKVDEATTLTSVAYADSVLTFTYTLDATLDKIDVDQFLQVEAHIREMTCKQEDAIMFFRYGGGTQTSHPSSVQRPFATCR